MTLEETEIAKIRCADGGLFRVTLEERYRDPFRARLYRHRDDGGWALEDGWDCQIASGGYPGRSMQAMREVPEKLSTFNTSGIDEVFDLKYDCIREVI